MLRRTLLTGSGAAAASAALPRFAIAQPASARTIVFVPQANLSSLDPIWTTATVTRNYAYMVFDTLFGTDDALVPQPQMAAGATAEDDGKRWTIKLRDGLLFHDNHPVRAKDCVASLQRWMKRDSFGLTLAERLDALEAPDDRTLVFRLKRRFPSLLMALGKTGPNAPVIMPERLAQTDPYKQITEIVGSGPFRYLPDQFVPGHRAVFAKFDGYQPRQDPPSSVAGAKRVFVDRVEWRVIPDPATAANALHAGEIDWLEMPLTDLIPSLKRDRGIVVGRLDPYGLYPVLRMNCLQGPTANRDLRQTILAAIDAREVMQAVMGDDSSLFNAPIGCFVPNSPYANNAAMDRLGPKPLRELDAMLRASGYRGDKVVLMHPTDQPFYDAMSQVCAAQLQGIGINVDDQAMDWGTVVQRRNSKEPLGKGGWSCFPASFPALDYVDPLSAPALRGTGDKAWYGWPTNPKVEELRDQFIGTDDMAARKRLAEQIQTEVFAEASFVPLGQYFQSAAWRSNLTGHLKAQPPIFWNVQKA